ncbi:MAG TPA: hypothetical protein VF170_15815, partial [Planctomycetaceae bacterium]
MSRPGSVKTLIAIAALLLAAGRAPAQDLSERVIAETLPKIVKLYGAGGFRGLDAYGTGFLA